MTGVSTPPGPARSESGRAVLLDGATAPAAPGRQGRPAGRAGRRLGRPATALRGGPPGPAPARRRPRGGRVRARRTAARGQLPAQRSGRAVGGGRGHPVCGRRRGTRTVAGAVEHSAVLVPASRGGGGLGLTPRPARGGGGRRVRTGAAGRVGAPPSHVPGHGRGRAAERERRGGHPAAAGGRVGGLPGPTAYRCSSTRRPAWGATPVPEAYDVLVGDARSWGGPAGVGVLVVPERTRWRRPGSGERGRVRTDRRRAGGARWCWRRPRRGWRRPRTAPTRSVSARGLVDQVRTAAARRSRTRWSSATRSTGCRTS